MRNLSFILMHGKLLIDAAVYEAIGDLEHANNLRLAAYELVCSKAYAEGCNDTTFDSDIFLSVYPEYEAYWCIPYSLGLDSQK